MSIFTPLAVKLVCMDLQLLQGMSLLLHMNLLLSHSIIWCIQYFSDFWELGLKWPKMVWKCTPRLPKSFLTGWWSAAEANESSGKISKPLMFIKTLMIMTSSI